MIREEFRLLNSEKLKTRRAVVYDLQTMTKHTRGACTTRIHNSNATERKKRANENMLQLTSFL